MKIVLFVCQNAAAGAAVSSICPIEDLVDMSVSPRSEGRTAVQINRKSGMPVVSHDAPILHTFTRPKLEKNATGTSTCSTSPSRIKINSFGILFATSIALRDKILIIKRSFVPIQQILTLLVYDCTKFPTDWCVISENEAHWEMYSLLYYNIEGAVTLML